MMQFSDRPDEGRAAFETKAAQHVSALANLTSADGKPNYAAINDYIDERRNQIWGDVKPYFMEAQHRKCGFCEVIITESTGDVEHYRPKNAVWSLAERGAEQEHLVNIRGRRFNKDFASGYWWLAYSWDNYLVSCPTCNQKWKSALFTVAEQRTSPPAVGDENAETPMLMDPFGWESPSAHLEFDDLGQVQALANSPIGSDTIVTCGLDRESLRSSRFEKAVRAFALLRNLSQAATPDGTMQILADFYELGRPEYVHYGMVRCIFVQNTGISWEDLERAIVRDT